MSEDILLADCEGDDLLLDATRIWCLAISTEEGEPTLYADQPGYPTLAEGYERLNNARKVIFHNGLGYDFWVLNKFGAKMRQEQQIDTLVLSRFRNPEAKHSLEEWGEMLGFPKWEFNDWSKFSKKMADYCLQDVRVLQRIWAKLKPTYLKYPKAVEAAHKTAYAIGKQNIHGFRFDVPAAQEKEAELQTRLREIEDGLQKVFPPIVHERWSEKTGKRLKDKVEVFNPGSRQQITRRLKDKYNWKPLVFTPAGAAKVDETVLCELPWPEAQAMNEYLSTQKKLSQLATGKNGWLALERNGRIHGNVNTIGCRTHRMSHWKPNTANVDKELREFWLPDEGDVLVGCDAEGLELRMLAHYLAKYDGGKYADIVVNGKKEDETDVHNVNKRAADLHKRDSAKTLIYALIYGGGNAKLGIISVDDARAAGLTVELPEDEETRRKKLTRMGTKLRGNLVRNIEGLEDLTNLAKTKHKKTGYMIGLDGRPIKSASEHSSLNTVLQSAGAIVMTWALNLFDDELERQYAADQVKYCANVHDEVQLSVNPEIAEEIGQLFASKITEAGEVLGVRCPLAGSYDIGRNWHETH